MHLGDHLCSVEEHKQSVQREGDILEWGVVLEGLGCVHANRDDTDDGTGSQKRVHPLQREEHKIPRMSTPTKSTRCSTSSHLHRVLLISGADHRFSLIVFYTVAGRFKYVMINKMSWAIKNHQKQCFTNVSHCVITQKVLCPASHHYDRCLHTFSCHT